MQSLGANPATVDSMPSVESSLLPRDTLDAIQTMSANLVTDPSLNALQAHISDLEQDLRNTEFRLQFLYHQRTTTLDLLAASKRQLEKLKK